MTQNILTFFTNCEAGTQIPGVLPGRNFKFIGLKLYLGKGAYSHLHGTDVVYNAGMDQAHVHVPDISTMRCLKKQTVFAMKN